MTRLFVALLMALTALAGSAVPRAGLAQSNKDWTIVDLAGGPDAPVATNADVELLYLYALVTPQWVYIRGELHNTTAETVAVPIVTATLRDGAGNAIEDVRLPGPYSTQPAPVYAIPPDGRMGVSGATQRPLEAWGHVTAEIGDVTPIDRSVLDAQSAGLELFNTFELKKEGMSLNLLGEVRNNGTTTATAVEVRLQFSLADGRYVGAATTDVYPTTLAPGETGSFAHYQAPYVVGPWTYTIAVVGLASAETPPETDRGIVELTADAPYEGEPPVERTGVELSYFYASDNTSLGWLNFYGEVRNTTDQPMIAPDFAVTFYDANGRVANSRRGGGVFDVILPGETVPIEVFTSLVPGSWTRAVLKLGPSEPADLSRIAEGLTVENVEAEQTATHLTLTGEIVNNGEQAAARVSITVLFYDDRGRYAGKDYAFPDSMDDLAPGQRVSFTFDEDVDADPGWTHRLIVEGRLGR